MSEADQPHMQPHVQNHRPKLIRELDARLDDLEAKAAAHINALDDNIVEIAQVLKMNLTIVEGLMEAVRALASDPGSPLMSARAANDILDQAQEDAYGGTAAGPQDDGVVPEPAGDQPGDT